MAKNKTDKEFNLKLVEAVEKHPCLYSYGLPEYTRNEVTEKAWTEVAIEMNESVTKCKERWKSVRTLYVRKVKKSEPSGKRKKSDYLDDRMQFVDPYVKSNSLSPNTSSSPPSEIIYSTNFSTDTTPTRSPSVSPEIMSPRTLSADSSRRNSVSPSSEIKSVNTLSGDSRRSSVSPSSEIQSTNTLSADSRRNSVTPSSEIQSSGTPSVNDSNRKSSLPPPVIKECCGVCRINCEDIRNNPTLSAIKYCSDARGKSCLSSPEIKNCCKMRCEDIRNYSNLSEIKYCNDPRGKSCLASPEINICCGVSPDDVDGIDADTGTDSNDPRYMFLMSLLPEIHEMSEYQMRRFKRKVLVLIDDILEQNSISAIPLTYVSTPKIPLYPHTSKTIQCPFANQWRRIPGTVCPIANEWRKTPVQLFTNLPPRVTYYNSSDSDSSSTT